MQADPLEVKQWLEWAGSKLLAMNIGSPAPREPHIAWPEYANDASVAYGYTGERLRPAMPRSYEIALMDKVLTFPSIIKDETTRRIIHSRALVTPVSNRYLYSWNKLGFMLHISPRRVVRIHHNGLCEIATGLTPEKIDAVKRLLTILSS